MYKFLPFFLLFISPSIMAQERVSFNVVSLNTDYSQTSVAQVYKDCYGFIWIATRDGLIKYNAYDIRFYQHIHGDKTSLCNDHVNCLYETKDSTFWIGTRNGLSKYIREKDHFYSYKYDPLDSSSINFYRVNSMLEDSKGRFWLASDGGGLNIFYPEKEKFINFQYDSLDSNSLASNSVYCIFEDKMKRFWIGTKEGLHRFDREKHVCIRIDNTSENGEKVGNVFTIEQYDDNVLWISGWSNELFAYYIREDKFKKVSILNRENYFSSISGCSKIIKGHNNNMWIATYNMGLFFYYRKNDKFINYPHKINKQNALLSNHISALYEDNQNIIWIGSNKGLNKYDPSKKKFFNDNHFKIGQNTEMYTNEIFDFDEDDEGNIWIASWDGVRAFDPVSRDFNDVLRRKKIPKELLNLPLNTLLVEDDAIWLGSHKQGLFKIANDRSVTVYNEQNGLDHNSVRALLKDDKGNIWVGTIEGVDKINVKTGKLACFLDSLNPAVTSLFLDHNDNLWIGKWGNGIYCYFSNKDSLISINQDNGLSNPITLDVIEDQYEHIWIATQSGLNMFNKKTGQVSVYHLFKNTKNDVIYSVIQEDTNTLWVSTNQGLARFFIDSAYFVHYDAVDGLPENEFTHNGGFKSRNGEIYFAGKEGFMAFNPDSMPNNSFVPPLKFTNIFIDDRELIYGEKHYPAERHLNVAKKIILPNNFDNVKIYFAALNYTNSHKNKYMWKLKGYDNQWKYSGYKRYVAFNNVPPGNYTLLVKGSNNENQWNEQPASLLIKVNKPYWLSVWFYLILVIVGIGVFYLYRQKERLKQKRRYIKSTLTEHEINSILQDLQEYMDDEKPFKKGELSIKDLAGHLNVSTHNLSQVINMKLNQNFFDFVNEYRVDESKRLLEDPDYNNYKLLAIAFEAGFNSKTSFFNTFKKYTGQTPAEYRRMHQK